MKRESFLVIIVVGWTLIVTAIPGLAQSNKNGDEVSVVQAVAPNYPAIARSARSEGEVIVEAKIDAEGKVTAATAVSGPELLRKSSETAALRWQFNAFPQGPKERVARLVFAYATQMEIRRDDPEFVISFKPPYRVEVKFNPPIVN